MNGGGEAGSDLLSVVHQSRQIAVTVFGRADIGCNRRKAEARRAPLQAVQPLAQRVGRQCGEIRQGLRKQRAEFQQALLAKQRSELSDARLIDVLHGREPR